ncbi:hypothetical protein CF335_g9097 [Tilletia laevis]|nr:hypothetical protein CF335_g9097 [Tilletia laevis]
MAPPKAPPDTPTRDEFAALDAARAKLDGDVSALRNSIDSNNSDIGSLKAEVGSLHSKFDELLNRLAHPVTTKTEPASTHTLASSTTGASTASSTFDAASTPPSPVTPKWNSAEAAFRGGMTPSSVSVGKNIRIQLPDAEESGRSFNIKPEELGFFHGVPEDTALFLSNIEAMRVSETDSGWDKAILRALPRTLRGPARLWFAALPPEQRKSSLTSLDAFIATIRTNFRPPIAVIRQQARARRWLPDSEDVVHYTFVKAAMLKTGWENMGEDELVSEVMEGIDPSIAKLVQTPFRADPTLSALRSELRMQETYWRAEYGRPLSRPANASSAAGVPAYDSLVAPLSAPTVSAFIAQADTQSGSPSADAFPQAPRPNTASSDPRRGRSIRSDFTPANLAIRMHPELKRMMMAYKIPDTTRLMWCVRPCDHCRGDHFGFAHEHCSKNTVPTVLAIEADEDYPCTEDTGF